MQKEFHHVLPVGEVISRLLDVSPLPQESKRLDKLSGGPILAETIMATEPLPPANRTASFRSLRGFGGLSCVA